jgi:L-ascorbate metabolism protein UlaG (beta-lactamase superfamily)
MISVVRQSSYTASPAGHIIRLEDGFTLCHAGDTGIFSSIKNTVELFPINLAMLPIGSVFTIDPTQASFATKLLGAHTVIPMQFKTFPILEQDTPSFKEIMKKGYPRLR